MEIQQGLIYSNLSQLGEQNKWDLADKAVVAAVLDATSVLVKCIQQHVLHAVKRLRCRLSHPEIDQSIAGIATKSKKDNSNKGLTGLFFSESPIVWL